MKKILTLSFLLLFVLIFQGYVVSAQSWKSMLDSTQIYYSKNEIKTALVYGERALEYAKTELGSLDSNIADIAAGLTFLHWSQKNFNKALEYARLDSTVRVQTRGRNNPGFAFTLMNIGAQYAGMKDNRQAEIYFIESYETGKKVFKETDQNLVNIRMNLIQFYKGIGEHEKADIIIREAGINPKTAETWMDLMDKSYEYYDKNDLINANEFGKKAFYLARKELGDKDTNVANIAKNLTFLFWSQQKYDEALVYARLDSVTRAQSFGIEHPSFPFTLMNIAAQYTGMRNIEKAEKYYIESVETAKSIYPGGHTDIINLSIELVQFYSNNGEYEKSFLVGKDALDLAKKEFGELDTIVANVAAKITYSLWAQKKFKEAQDYARLDSSIRVRLSGKENMGYITALYNLGANYNGNMQFDMAEKSFLEAIQIIQKIIDKRSPNYLFAISNLGQFYSKNGDFVKAEPYYNEAHELIKQSGMGDNNEIARSLTNLGEFYKDKSDYPNAEKFYIEALSMRKRISHDGKSTDIADVLRMMGDLYSRKGDLDNAEKYFMESLEICRQNYPAVSQELVQNISILGRFYQTIGEFKKSEPLFLEIIEINKKLYNGDNPNLVQSMNMLGYYFYLKGDYKKSEKILTEALEMCRRLFKGDSPDLASSINNMAFFFEARKEYGKAEPLFIEALQMARRLFKNNNNQIIVHVHNLAYFYNGQGKYELAEPLYKEAIELSRQNYKGDNPDFVNTIINAGFLYYNIGDYQQAEKLFKEAYEMASRIFDDNNIKLAGAIQSLGNFYKNTQNFMLAGENFTKALKIFINVINDYFPSLSETEKKNFWAAQSEVFESFYSFGAESSSKIPKIAEEMYDLQLYSKALLFNSSIKIKNRIINSRDSNLINLHNKYTSQRELLASIYSMPETTRKQKGFDLDSIELSALTLEKQLSLKSEDFKLSYEKKKVTWKIIQGLLKPDEAAVEVIRFRYFDKLRWTDTIYYAFLIVSNETVEQPDIVIFRDGNKLENEYYNEYRKFIKIKSKDNVSYERFWGSLNDKLKDYKKIYFSPDGVYNRLNPSTLMMPDGKFLLDIQDIQQVNSTKDLLLGYYQTKQESNLLNSAILIGNPNFGLQEDKVKETARKIRGEKQDEKNREQLANVRGNQLTRLPGTEKEIKDIEKFLKAKNWIINSYLGDMAVKTAVKNANSPRILHIATHGLFLEDVEHNDKNLFGFEEQKMVENPLLRSGLFFTGADNYIKKDNPGYIEEDNGLMTAYEAMNLNLDKTELVVLSACETGLGEIQNGEGVFGLRRAFQQAGAKTVLMSLWKVSDDATQMLMSSFYQNWVSGMTKRDAFAKAQQEVRDKYPAPYYWGAFVMVGE